MIVSQITLSRSHHFHLARQFEQRGFLKNVFTAYPKFKLQGEDGVPRAKIRTFPWIHSSYMAAERLGWTPRSLAFQWESLAIRTLDRFAASRLGDLDGIVALAGCGLRSGEVVKRRGGFYVCDRGSVHIRTQEDLLREEHARWGVAFTPLPPDAVLREEAEYESADSILVPSRFARQTYLDRGISPEKVCLLPYGIHLGRFQPDRTSSPAENNFTVLFIGSVCLRKGFLHLLKAFASLKVPNKRLIAIGIVDPPLRSLMSRFSMAGVELISHVPNEELPRYYQTASVFVLPSIEDGFGLTVHEALACGCPVIVSSNTGGSESIQEGVSGLVVPPGDSRALKDALERVAGGGLLGLAAGGQMPPIPTWESYGDGVVAVLDRLAGGGKPPAENRVRLVKNL